MNNDSQNQDPRNAGMSDAGAHGGAASSGIAQGGAAQGGAAPGGAVQSGAEPQATGGHEVPLTPPPVPPVPPAAPSASAAASDPTPSSSRGAGARAGAIAIAAFGGVALLGAGGTAAFAAVHDVTQSSRGSAGETQTVNVDGIEGIDIDVSASGATVRFGDVDEATLEIDESNDSRWRLERDEDELVLRNDDDSFWWFGDGWFGERWFDFDERVVLTLPEELNDESLDAEFSLGAGSLDVEGMFDEVDISVGAGSLRLDGAASSVEADIQAGHARLDLARVDEADLSVSAGKLEARFAETTPRSVAIRVSAGELDLTVPDETYNVRENVSAGDLDNRLDTASSSRHTIEVRVSAGDVILRPAD
ncbi:DUF4097 family beta strand repeat-containing protein [Microbacterium sp.]|uniref:DUF4097 family beta strand repeat-containing protein n=1 Tax=Microbacterium sp. TaxID=51671 RepID=UPI0026273093|nr:DUF4097 family beta strand repeat-containing protein [Microbacterium sp.]